MTVIDQPTIFAPASAPDRAGVAIIRISGPAAANAITRLCRPATLPVPRVATTRTLVNPVTAEPIDHALILWFKAPHSFTGEDTVEFHCHGGRAILQAVTAALQSLPDFRLAEPGEFTRRAFENNKLDLTEAEAIADLVAAETEAQRKQALRQLDGALGTLYRDWTDRLKRALALTEADIDFADEDLPPDIAARQLTEIETLTAAIAAHLNDARRGEILREGFTIAILGAPNAGKSSLLNALAGREAAIVSATPGTTRDIIEIRLDLGGYPVTLADTAGLRDSLDAIESEGIRRALARAEQADLKLLLFDSTMPRDAATEALIDANSLIVVTKSDIMTEPTSHPTWGEGQGGGLPQSQPALHISTTTGHNLTELTNQLTAFIAIRFTASTSPALTRARHRTALEEAVSHLTRSLSAPEAALRAEDLRLALRAIGRITGKVDVEDLLDVIFREFCIGK